jgi:hypothetical protein
MALSASGARNELMAAIANNSDRLVIDKASLANAAAGQLFSLWRATGQPAQGAIPGTTPALCTSALAGAFGLTNQTAPVTSYLAWLSIATANNGPGIAFHDRIAHSGGLVLNVTTLQSITGLNLTAGGLNPPAARLGASDYSDVQWFLEVYADGGATASNATVNVTFDDGTSANLNVIAVGGTLRAGRMIALTPFIQVANQGRYIRGINSVQLSASTGTAGNFGFTCTRQRTEISTNVANKTEVFSWAMLGLPEIPNDSCIQMVMSCITTTTGTVRGQGKFAHA